MALSAQRIADLEAKRAQAEAEKLKPKVQSPAEKQASYDQAIADVTPGGKIPYVGPVMQTLQRLGLGIEDLGVDAYNRVRQIGGGMGADIGIPGAEGLSQRAQSDIDSRAEMMSGLSDPTRTGGYVGAAMIPAAVAATATPAVATTAGASKAMQTLGAMMGSGLEGFVTQPQTTAQMGDTEGRVKDTAINTGLGVLGPAVGGLINKGKGMYHAGKNYIYPEDAAREFGDRLTRAADDVPVPPRTPAGAGDKTVTQLMMNNEVNNSVENIRRRAGAHYAAANNRAAGLGPISTTAGSNAALEAGSDVANTILSVGTPKLRNLIVRTTNATTRRVPGATPQAPDILLPREMTLPQMIDTTKELSRIARELGNRAEPPSSTINQIRKLQTALDDDINAWGRTGEGNRLARDDYVAGREIYRNEYVPLTAKETAVGKFYGRGKFPSSNTSVLFNEGAGPSVRSAMNENPELVKVLRRKLGETIHEKAGKPAEMTEMIGKGNTIENITNPREAAWLEQLKQKNESLVNEWQLKTAIGALLRRNPVAGIIGSEAADRAWRGILPYGVDDFTPTQNTLARILGGSGASTLNTKAQQE